MEMRKKGFARLISLSIFFLIGLHQCTDGEKLMESNPKGDFKVMREKMVETQIKARGVKDTRVLSAMLRVERHRFVPEEYWNSAYSDQPLPIGEGQTISQPYIVALMTELLELKEGEKILEIGTGSGYQAAILAELAKEVYTIEIIESLASMAKKRLSELGYQNIEAKAGDGYLGWPEFAPFDAIIVTAAPDHIPKPLIEQLKEGGRMVLPVGVYTQELKKIIKRSGKIETTDIIPVVFVPMTGEGVKGKK
jgi:protein-L-isoaspartate(D-aspartate) O-methyltransferase